MEHSENISIPIAEIYKTNSSLFINRKEGFLSLGICNISPGLKKVQNIIYSSLELSGTKEEVLKKFNEYLIENNLSGSVTGSYNGQNRDNLIIKQHKDFTLLLGLPFNHEREKFTDNLEKIKKSLNASIPLLDIIIIVHKPLTEDVMLSCFKTAIEAKTMALENVGIPLDQRKSISIIKSQENKVSPEETLIIACPVQKEEIERETSKINELLKSIASFVDKYCQEAFKEADFSLGILDYIYQQGITIDDLANAGLELCVGVEVTSALRDKLKNQILKSLEDLNVIALLMAAIRVENDFQNHRVREVNVDDDPAYLYTDEVLGMAIANQIAGTKAIFNFKRYDEEKPGIISTLGPMVDDIFAGLVAGCMSKIFEE